MSPKFDTPITRFYAGKTVLLTGATGCVGKVFLEKLLYSCRDIGRVYVLMRHKKRTSNVTRVDELIRSPVFSGPNRISLNFLKEKIVPIYGDLGVPGLGMSRADKELVLTEVDIVVHSAASVRFDDPVNDMLKVNYTGTRTVVDLCNEMYKVKALIHVSTCTSNCHLGTVDEVVYPTKITGDQLIELSTWLDDEQIDKLARKNMFEGRPNSYTFTKSLAENYVNEKCSNSYSVAIARLSIVAPAMDEPEPGFVDTAGAANFIGITQVLGAMRTIKYDPETVLDGLPVDIVADALIVIGRELALSKPDKVQVYHVCAGPDYKTTQEIFFKAGDLVARDLNCFNGFRPVASLASPPSTFEFLYKKYILEFFFAFMVDVLLTLTGQKSSAMKSMKFVSTVRKENEPFMLRTFRFNNGNFAELIKRMDPLDEELFRIADKIDRFFNYYSTVPRLVEYFRVSSLSYMRNKCKDVHTPENEDARQRHKRTLYIRELVGMVIIHALLAGAAYAALITCTFLFSTLTS